MKIVVASKNPVKIEATRLAFSRMFASQKLEIESVSASSLVSGQPKSDERLFWVR